jgi:hypothetical protein
MKMHSQNITVPLSSGHIHKRTESYARRIVKYMMSDKTPEATRHKLREALQRLFACTDISKRRSLTKVENVTAVLGCTGLYRLGTDYLEAREARTALCRVMEDYDRVARPWLYPWLHDLGVSEHSARRTPGQHTIAAPAPVATRIAA